MNKTLFASATQKQQQPLVLNEAGGMAYRLGSKQALAQLVATGTLSQTFYVDAHMQLQQVIDLARGLDTF